jgi:Arc/MetJ-type ribon-helix-helix transcriptional regulator
MSVDIPAELAPFVERLIAERRFNTESEVRAEATRDPESIGSRLRGYEEAGLVADHRSRVPLYDTLRGSSPLAGPVG